MFIRQTTTIEEIRATSDTVTSAVINHDAHSALVAILPDRFISAILVPPVSETNLRSLPGSITTVALPSDISPSLVKLLPDHITCVWLAPGISVAAVKELHENVRRIVIVPGLSVSVVSSLPDHIRCVYIQRDVAEVLVRALSRKVQSVVFGPGVTWQTFLALPGYIRRIDISEADETLLPYLPSNIVVILSSKTSKSLVEKLPFHIRRIEIGGNIPLEVLAALPPNINEIILDLGVTSESIRALPPHITTIYFHPSIELLVRNTLGQRHSRVRNIISQLFLPEEFRSDSASKELQRLQSPSFLLYGLNPATQDQITNLRRENTELKYEVDELKRKVAELNRLLYTVPPLIEDIAPRPYDASFFTSPAPAPTSSIEPRSPEEIIIEDNLPGVKREREKKSDKDNNATPKRTRFEI